jgi:uncharacterized protein with NRDE domain
MCLAVFAYRVHSKYPFIFATNRDEFYQRPAQPATFWYDHPTLLAGRDLQAGGTWMGITKENRFAALTNYRDLNNIIDDAPSRGDIVVDFLTSDLPTAEFLKALQKTAHKYNGFNLIAGTIDELWYYTNQKKSITKIEPGYYSLSNAFLNTEWPKTVQASKDFRLTVKNENSLDQKAIFDLLQNKTRYPDEQLPSTGLSKEMESVVSSIFITSENYGTRCSTLIFQDDTGSITFNEKTYNPGTTETDVAVKYQF